jgi:ribosomal protein L16/L10AE
MKKINLTSLVPSARTAHPAPGARAASERAQAEEAALAGSDGRHRRRLGKTKQLTLRVTPAMHALILKLADKLSDRKGETISVVQTVEEAIYLLEAKLSEEGK